MEIRSVKNELKPEYPKINSISKKTLKKSIPSKWLKIGITSWVLTLISEGQAFAISNALKVDTDIAGGVRAPIEFVTSGDVAYIEPINVPLSGVAAYEIPLYIRVIKIAAPVVGITSFIAFLTSLIIILRLKKKMKKENSELKIKKRYKIILISSIILLLASVIAYILIRCC